MRLHSKLLLSHTASKISVRRISLGRTTTSYYYYYDDYYYYR